MKQVLDLEEGILNQESRELYYYPCGDFPPIAVPSQILPGFPSLWPQASKSLTTQPQTRPYHSLLPTLDWNISLPFSTGCL